MSRGRAEARPFFRPVLSPLRTLLILAALVLSCRAQPARPEKSAETRQAESAKAIEALFSGLNSVELFALDPSYRQKDDDPAPKLSRWKITARATLADPKAIARLGSAIAGGIRESDGATARCFNPRHALRFQKDGKDVTVIICFECLQASVEGAADIKGFITTGRPEPAFDDVFAAAGIKQSK